MTSFTCPRCGGTGQEITSPCSDCRGEGRVVSEEEIIIEVPPGVQDGTQIRKRGSGDAGHRGGAAGDLYVGISVLPYEGIERSGDDLIMFLSIPFSKAVLGGPISIDTFEGQEQIDVPAGTQSGKVFKLRGRGVPHLQASGRGDMLVRVDINVPKDLDDEQRDLLERFAAARGETVGEPTGLLGKIKSAFKPG